MILPVIVNLKEIEEQGRNYPWIRPEVCLRCRGSHLWGHGFVESWFDGYIHALLLRRYICPVCGYTAEKEAPVDCPVCGTAGKMFKKID